MIKLATFWDTYKQLSHRTQQRERFVQFHAWCPDCRTYHLHGGGLLAEFDSKAEILGHRIAHCDSKYATGDGYLLSNAGPVDTATEKDIERKRPKGPTVSL